MKNRDKIVKNTNLNDEDIIIKDSSGVILSREKYVGEYKYFRPFHY